MTSSASAVGVPGPAAQATTRPGSQQTCNSITPGSSGSSSSSSSAPRRRGSASPRGSPMRRVRAAASRFRSAVRSATTWSRSLPVIVHALARCSSVSRIRRARDACHPSRSASSDRDLVRRRKAFGFRADVLIELPGADLGRRLRRACLAHASPRLEIPGGHPKETPRRSNGVPHPYWTRGNSARRDSGRRPFRSF